MSLVPPKASPLVPGYRLDRYELLCPIAQGGMAEVWVARLRGKHGFEKLVAIKSILPQFTEDHNFQKMFLDEAHIASGIEHQNVAQIMDLGEEHGLLYLVMEWIDGDAVSKLHRAVDKKGEKIPIGVVLRILADTCGGLHAAHELSDKEGHNLGVVHRDVSPQNILVTTRGVAKLIDFGIAKARDRVAGETSSGMLKGKIQYMAPEQALGQPIDRRADVWAIGAILYHLVSGRPPFDGPNQLATLHLLASGATPPPLPKSVPEPVVDIVRRTLRHDPDKRIGTAADLQKALESAMAEAWVHTSTADVAACLQSWVPDRADARRRAVELALKAAEQREKMREMLTPPNADSSNSFSDNNAKLAQVRAESRAGIEAARAAGTLANFDGLDVQLPPAGPTIPPMQDASATTTLGSSLLESVPPDPDPVKLAKRKRLVIGIVAGAALIGLVGGIFAIARKRDDGHPERPAAAATADKADDKADDKKDDPVAKRAPPPPSTGDPAVAPSTAPTVVPSASVSAKVLAVATGKVPPIAAPTAKTTATVKTPPAASGSGKWKPINDGF